MQVIKVYSAVRVWSSKDDVTLLYTYVVLRMYTKLSGAAGAVRAEHIGLSNSSASALQTWHVL